MRYRFYCSHKSVPLTLLFKVEFVIEPCLAFLLRDNELSSVNLKGIL